MKFLVLLLALFSITAQADMLGAGVGFGQGSQPSYGADYEFVKSDFSFVAPYADISIYANKTFVQQYGAIGLQFEKLSFGLAVAATSVNQGNGQYQGQLSFGPEFGIMQNITKAIYVKENNSYLDYHGTFNFGSTLSLGLNL